MEAAEDDTEPPFDLSRCGVWDDEARRKVATCSFWMEGVLLSITGTTDYNISNLTIDRHCP